MISVIIPVYNVEKYIDQCLESVVGQTYSELEIIIVYDNSSDNSYTRCIAWSERDKRIQLIVNQKRGGLAAARNLGVLRATGQYVLFVDSDDWLDTNYIEMMHETITRTGADFISSSSYYEVTSDSISIRHGMPEGLYQTREMKEILLCGDFVTMWKKMYRRKWLLNNQLMQPELLHYEDWGAYPLMCTAAKTVYVSEIPGVYYRLEREGSLSFDNETDILVDFGKALQFIFNYLDKYEAGSREWKSVKYYCLRDYYGRMLTNQKSENLQARKILEDIKKQLLVPRFGEFDFVKLNCLIMGSFSLRWEVQKGCLMDCKADKHFCFSSIISALSETENQFIIHDNPFRKLQIEQEMRSLLLQTIEEADAGTWFFIDFMEERFDVLELEGGVYVTESDAYLESNLRDLPYIKRIKSGSAEHMRLWKQACEKLIYLLKKHMNPGRIVLVKNRLSYVYGNFSKRQSYDNKLEIKSVNQTLEQMEDFFIKHMPGVMIVEDDINYLFTDKRFRMGCCPEYVNNAWYGKIGVQIFEKIFQEWEEK